MKKCVLTLVGILFLVLPGASWGEDFRQWLEGFYPRVANQGICRATWETAFDGIEQADVRVLEKARFQPEFTAEIWEYLDSRVTPLSVERGLQMERDYAQTLAAVENRFGVEAKVLLAIWSMESAYGAIFDKPERLHYVPQALATLAYADPKRKKFAEKQLVAVLQILQAGDVGRQHLNGSWSGAMGHTQFIPTSYLAYAVDMDGNGRRDIWNSVPDALATAANLLHSNGWQSGKTWGYEVILPTGGKHWLNETRILADWQKAGFSRTGGKTFPRPDDRAVLKLPAGKEGPAFLVLRNFFVLKRYNNADAYALAVGLLADRLAGSKGLVQPWPRPPGTLNGKEKFLLQELLKKKGYYSGEIDGLLGEASRAAIRIFQAEAGMPADGKPSLEILDALRQ
ncbi:MAG TPA: lytic murein transglycosylase [Desulfotignum sp.]|nr:lytic murein transglycosylase [Desulfotignum sp.]